MRRLTDRSLAPGALESAPRTVAITRARKAALHTIGTCIGASGGTRPSNLITDCRDGGEDRHCGRLNQGPLEPGLPAKKTVRSVRRTALRPSRASLAPTEVSHQTKVTI